MPPTPVDRPARRNALGKSGEQTKTLQAPGPWGPISFRDDAVPRREPWLVDVGAKPARHRDRVDCNCGNKHHGLLSDRRVRLAMLFNLSPNVFPILITPARKLIPLGEGDL